MSEDAEDDKNFSLCLYPQGHSEDADFYMEDETDGKGIESEAFAIRVGNDGSVGGLGQWPCDRFDD